MFVGFETKFCWCEDENFDNDYCVMMVCVP